MRCWTSSADSCSVNARWAHGPLVRPRGQRKKSGADTCKRTRRQTLSGPHRREQEKRKRSGGRRGERGGKRTGARKLPQSAAAAHPALQSSKQNGHDESRNPPQRPSWGDCYNLGDCGHSPKWIGRKGAPLVPSSSGADPWAAAPQCCASRPSGGHHGEGYQPAVASASGFQSGGTASPLGAVSALARAPWPAWECCAAGLGGGHPTEGGQCQPAVAAASG